MEVPTSKPPAGQTVPGLSLRHRSRPHPPLPCYAAEGGTSFGVNPGRSTPVRFPHQAKDSVSNYKQEHQPPSSVLHKPPNMETQFEIQQPFFFIYLELCLKSNGDTKFTSHCHQRFFSGKLFSFIKHIKTYKVGLLMYLYSHKLISLK